MKAPCFSGGGGGFQRAVWESHQGRELCQDRGCVQLEPGALELGESLAELMFIDAVFC